MLWKYNKGGIDLIRFSVDDNIESLAVLYGNAFITMRIGNILDGIGTYLQMAAFSSFYLNSR